MDCWGKKINDMGSLISVNTDGIAKLGEIIAHCTGWHAHGIKKNAEAQYYADELQIKSVNNVALIKEQGNDALSQYVYQREQRKASNVAKIVQKTSEQFELGEPVPEESLSEDWLNRYFEYAESISEDDMQNLWAKILAGEIKQPMTYSKRTLDVVRNLSTKEAELINKYAGKVIGDAIVRLSVNDDLLELAILDDAGLLNTQDLTLNIEVVANVAKILCADSRYILVINSKTNKKISYSIRILTEAGKQIVHLIDPSLDIPFMEKLAESIAKEYDVEVSMHEVLQREGSSFQYRKQPIWTKLRAENDKKIVTDNVRH